MNIELDYHADIDIRHRYKAMTIEIEDSYGNLPKQVVQSIIAEEGIDVLFEGILDKEDLRKLYLYFKEDFEEIILEEGE